MAALASEIVTRAFREANLVPLVSSPSTLEAAEGLSLLNSLILSTVGNEAGGELSDLTIGGQYDQSNQVSEYIPVNARLILNLAAATTYKLHPLPYNGQRVAVADVGANLGTYNLVLSGNGRRIETAASITLNTNSLARQWMYRADTGNWVKITDLVAGDTMPFPTEFDDYFIVALALRLAPRHSAAMPQESMAAHQRAKGQLQARYRRPRGQQDIGPVTGQSGSTLGSDLLR